MELQSFIGDVLQQLEELPRNHQAKHNYIIEELIFEIHVSEINQINGRVNVIVGNIGGDTQTQNSHKMTLKLKPKNRHSRIVRQTEY
jgi:hypothetical protein